MPATRPREPSGRVRRGGRSPSSPGGGRAVRAPAMAEEGDGGGGGGPGGAEDGVGESSSPPRAPAPAASGASGGGCRGGGGGGVGGRDVCREVFERLVADGHVEAAGASGPELRAQLEAHFARLPTSYQLDVNVDKAEDVLIHQKVLAEAKDPDRRPAFAVRFLRLEEVNVAETTNSDAHEEGADTGEAFYQVKGIYTHIHEILFSTTDKPKLLSQLSALLSDIALNIREAHVFSTTDGYSLDAFVVDGWPIEGLRPQVPENAHPRLLILMQRCWEALPSNRPSFADIITELEDIQAQAQGTSGESSQKQKDGDE
ncbi:serine/threonine-protein kinase STY46-like isoform X5 [Panicum virgatum]|uniref:serine/threonine-protein kinase STY46-like isoform X5 n=1 Tax=Panicum virgatum TaxID=38727 RepID=UPI0019D6511D|nr:serine/threonine-protein kinase STY46-like isoform X5 [Panicum virgatum]